MSQIKNKRPYTLFTVGPVQMFDRTFKIKQKQLPYFRNQAFSDFMLSLDRKLKILLETSDATKIIYLTASGTAAMDATIANLFTNKNKLLIINGGSFGQRFVNIAKCYGIPYDELKVADEKDLVKEDFLPYIDNDYDGVLVNIDETSNAKLYDINLIEEFALSKNALLVVDAISSFLCDEYEMDKHHIDVTIFSSQKGLCVSPGLAFVALSKKAQEHLIENPNSFYFDYYDYISNMERGQTPFTPALGTLYETNDIVDYILEIGLDNWLKHIEDNANYFRKLLIENNFKLPTYKQSNAVTMFYTPNGTAKQLKEYLASNNIYINPSSGIHADDAVRVASIGNLDKVDYDLLVENINSFYGANN